MKTKNYKKIKFSAVFFRLFLFSCLFFSSMAYSASLYWDNKGGDGKWETVGNWSSTNGSHTAVSAIPGSADQVTVTGGYSITISTNVGTINKLYMLTSAAAAPTLTINAGGSIIVTANASATSCIIMAGASLVNNGSLTLNPYTGASYGIDFRVSGGAFKSANSYSGNGNLTINSAYTGNAANCINFAQTEAVTSFGLGSGTYTFNANSGYYVFGISSSGGGAVSITGSGSITIGSSQTPVAFGLIQANISATGKYGRIIIDSNVFLTAYCSTFGISNGIININNSVATTSSSITNNGSITLGGTCSNGIYISPYGTTGNPATIDTLQNNGTIAFTGSFTQSALRIGNYGLSKINNTGTVTFDNISATGSGIGMSAAPTCTITNSGTIIFNSSNNYSNSIVLGSNLAVVNNSGSITVNKGSITGGASSVASLNNLSNGLLNFNFESSSTNALGTNILLTNNNGTIAGNAYFPVGTVAFDNSTPGILSPGGDTGYGILDFKVADGGSFALKGLCKMNVKNKSVGAGAGSPGVDFDRIQASSSGNLASIDLSGASLQMTIDPSYIPINGDLVGLFYGNNNGHTGTFSGVSLPNSHWTIDYNNSNNLEVTYAIYSDLGTSVKSTQTESGIYAKGSSIIIEKASGQSAYLYLINGVLKQKVALTSDYITIPVAERGIYLVVVGDKKTKVTIL